MGIVEKPLASIVVTTYNQEDSLPATLDSLVSQKTTFMYEIVVGEDCSTDGTRTVLMDYAKRYPEIIRPILNGTNLGILSNYISTLSQCKGKYIAGCAGDDFWNDSEKLQLQVDIMEKYSEIGLVYTDVNIDSVTTGERFVRKCQDPHKELFTQLLLGCFITAPTVCYRSELLKYVDYNKFAKLGFTMEDYPTWLTFSLHTKFYHLQRPTVTYRIDRGYINDAKLVSLHACEFDENTTKIRLFFRNEYPEKTALTESEILDAHYQLCYSAGINMNDRKFTLKYASMIHEKNNYVHRLVFISRSHVLFGLYQLYRKFTGKTRTALQMYFGQ